MAKVHSRKELEKQLERARKDYNDARTSLDSSSKEHSRLEKLRQEDTAKMQAAKSALSDINEHIHIMDLTGANGVRDRGDCKTYLVNDKEFKADKSSADDMPRMIPWKEYKESITPKEIEEKLETLEPGDIVIAYKESLKTLTSKS